MAIHKMRPGASRRGLRGAGRRGLGTLAVPVSGGMIYGSDVVARTGTRYPIVRPTGMPISNMGPIGGSPWPTTYSPVWGAGYQPPRTYPMNNGTNLAQLQALAQSNPAALTPSQVQQLQAAGTLPGTLPAANSSLISTGSGAIDPATGQTYASELASAQATLATATTPTTNPLSAVIGTDPTTGATTVFGVDWYWLAGAAVAAYVLLGRRGRR